HVRGQNQPLGEPGALLQWRALGDRVRVARAGAADIELRAVGGRAARVPRRVETLVRRVEGMRGYGSSGPVENAAALHLALGPGEQGALVVSVEPGAVERHGTRSVDQERARRQRISKDDQAVS